MSLLKDIIEESFDVKESYGRTFINEKKKKSTGKWKMSDAERKAEKQKKHEENKQKNLQRKSRLLAVFINLRTILTL